MFASSKQEIERRHPLVNNIGWSRCAPTSSDILYMYVVVDLVSDGRSMTSTSIHIVIAGTLGGHFGEITGKPTDFYDE